MPCITKRQEHLVTVEVFTPCSTVVVHTGETGRRVTEWALNRNDPAAPHIGDGVVSFEGRTPRLHQLTRKPVRPGPNEVARNPRSRSARLRVAERIQEAA